MHHERLASIYQYVYGPPGHGLRGMRGDCRAGALPVRGAPPKRWPSIGSLAWLPIASCPLPLLSEPFHLSFLFRSLIRSEAQQRRAESASQSSSSGAAAEGDGAWPGTPAEATEMVVHHSSILRNKRLLFAYV